VESSPASPPPMQTKLEHQPDREGGPIIHRQHPLFQDQYTQPTGDNLMYGYTFQQEGSLPGPLLACHTYPPQQPYHAGSTAGDQFGYYLVPIPDTPPPTMHFHEAQPEGDIINPFNTGYPEHSHPSRGYGNSHVSTIPKVFRGR